MNKIKYKGQIYIKADNVHDSVSELVKLLEEVPKGGNASEREKVIKDFLEASDLSAVDKLSVLAKVLAELAAM